MTGAALLTPGAWVGVGPADLSWTECGACSNGGMWVPFRAPLVQHQVVSPDSVRTMGVADLFLDFRGKQETSVEEILSVVRGSGTFAPVGDPLPAEDYLYEAMAPLGWFGRVSVFLGVRRALGAKRMNVVRLVFGKSIKIFALVPLLGTLRPIRQATRVAPRVAMYGL